MKFVLAGVAALLLWRWRRQPASEANLLSDLGPLSEDWLREHIYNSGQRGDE